MYTGLPTVLGWEHHVNQRGASREIIRERAQEIELIYSTADAAIARNIMKKYDAKYLLLGELERKRYPALNEVKFSGSKFFHPVYQSIKGLEHTTLYEVADIRSED
jgi:uncharacterized membrane protein